MNASGSHFLHKYTQMMAPVLTESEKALRDCFVIEYLKDFSAFNACLRIGFQVGYAMEYSKQFMVESYVLQKIKEHELAAKFETESKQDHSLVISTLRREMQYAGPGSSHAARVTAAAQLARLTGMEPPVKTQSDVNITSPIQFYLPSNGRDAVLSTGAMQ